MGKLIYCLNLSLDGYVETPEHGLDWTAVDDELHTWFNDRARQIAVSFYGRGMYELMSAYWPTAASDPSVSAVELEFARIWVATPKVVFSSTLREVDRNSRLASGDVADELARVRAEVDGDIEVAGATLAAEFVRRGLVDEYQVVVHPVILGAGTPFLPPLDAPLRLRLLETRRFGSGVVYAGYGVVR